MFAENLKSIRKRKGISQASLAAGIGKSQQAVSWYESGKICPPLRTIEEIAEFLDVSVSQLISRDKP